MEAEDDEVDLGTPDANFNASLMSNASGDFGHAFSTLSKRVDGLLKRVNSQASTGDELALTGKALKVLEEKYAHQVSLQEQKDKAQDEMLSMQFETIRRDLSTYIRGQDMEDQKLFLLSKINNIDLEMKESLRSLSTALREEVSRDSRRLQDQLEKVSAAVIQQVKMVDERLKENAAADNLFEKLVRERLSRVEAELGLEDPGANGEGGGGGGQGGRGKLKGAAAEAVAQMETRFDVMAETVAKLQQMMQEQQQHLSELRDSEKPASKHSRKLENRVSSLEDRVDDVAEKGARAGQDIESLKEVVKREPNPMDWLEEKVGELAKRKGGEREQTMQRLSEASNRLEALEKWREELVAKEEAAAFMTEPPVEAEAPKEGDEDDEEDDESQGGYSSFGGSRGPSRSGRSALVSSKNGPVSVTGGGELSYVNLFEDMERLRCIVEAMEPTMPVEVRRAIGFFKGPRKNLPDSGGKTGSRGGSQRKQLGNGGQTSQSKAAPPGFELEAEVLELRSESDDHAQRVQRMEELLSREASNLLKAVRGVEREQDQMKLRVDDLWHKFPQLLAILDPLQVRLEGSAAESDLQVQAESAIEALKPLGGLLESALQKSIDRLRQDLLRDLSEVRGGLETKASSDDFVILRDRVDRWARGPMTPSKPSLASYRGKALDRQPNMELTMSQPRSPDRLKSAGSPIHEKCKHTTCPCSASTGRLPSLSRTR